MSQLKYNTKYYSCNLEYNNDIIIPGIEYKTHEIYIYIYILKYTIYEANCNEQLTNIQCETTYIKPYHVKGQGFTPWTSCVTKYTRQ